MNVSKNRTISKICFLLEIRKLFNFHTQLLVDPYTCIYQRKGESEAFFLNNVCLFAWKTQLIF